MDGIICGHIHQAELREIDGVLYANCGDWVESCTALAETHSGELKLIDWKTRRLDELAPAFSGGLFCTESLAAGLPVFFPVINTGHEQQNARYLIQSGVGVAGTDREAWGREILGLLMDAGRLAALSEGARRVSRPRAAEVIIEDFCACFQGDAEGV